jgi:hypothetical protein
MKSARLFSEYPAILEHRTFYLQLNAGSALGEDAGDARIPIATARLIVDVGRAPYITDITPSPLVCGGSASSEVTVNVADYDVAVARHYSGARIWRWSGSQLMATRQAYSAAIFRRSIRPFIRGDLRLPHRYNVALAPERTNQGRVYVAGRAKRAGTGSGRQPALRLPRPCRIPPHPCAHPYPLSDRDGDGLNDCGADNCRISR